MEWPLGIIVFDERGNGQVKTEELIDKLHHLWMNSHSEMPGLICLVQELGSKDGTMSAQDSQNMPESPETNFEGC